ncbi:MAG TPA: hypothetical protein VF700_08170, partial [Segetibacter sp.]
FGSILWTHGKTGELYGIRLIKNSQILVSFAIYIDIIRLLPYRQILLDNIKNEMIIRIIIKSVLVALNEFHKGLK